MIMIFWSFLVMYIALFWSFWGLCPLDPTRVPTWTHWGASSTPIPPAAIGDDLHHDFFAILNMCIDPCIGETERERERERERGGGGGLDKYNSLQGG